MNFLISSVLLLLVYNGISHGQFLSTLDNVIAVPPQSSEISQPLRASNASKSFIEVGFLYPVFVSAHLFDIPNSCCCNGSLSSPPCHMYATTRARQYLIHIALAADIPYITSMSPVPGSEHELPPASEPYQMTWRAPHQLEHMTIKDNMDFTLNMVTYLTSGANGYIEYASSSKDCYFTTFNLFERFLAGNKSYFLGLTDSNGCLFEFKSLKSFYGEHLAASNQIDVFAEQPALSNDINGDLLPETPDELRQWGIRAAKKDRDLLDELNKVASAIWIPYPLARDRSMPETQLHEQFKLVTLSARTYLGTNGSENHMHFVAFDESGRMNLLVLDLANRQWVQSSKFTKQFSLSQYEIALDPNVKTPGPPIKPEIAIDSSRYMEALRNQSVQDSLKDQYMLSYVESITSVGDYSICWSRGLRNPPSLHVVECSYTAPNSIPQEHSGKELWMPNGLTTKRLNHKASKHMQPAIFAMEILETKTKRFDGVIYHFVSSEMVYGEGEVSDHLPVSSTYWMCKFERPSNSTRVDFFKVPEFNKPFNSNKTSQTSCKTTMINRVPQDIVSYKANKCHKVLAFYNHMYQAFEPDQPITDSAKMYIKEMTWAKFPINAIHYNNLVWYFILPGNTMITIQSALPPNDAEISTTCEMVPFRPETVKEFRTSEMLRPFFLLTRRKTSYPRNASLTGMSEFSRSESKWSRDFMKEIQPIPFSPIGKGINDTAEPSDSSSVTIAFAALIFVIILILLGVLLYVCCGKGSGEQTMVGNERKLVSLSTDASTKSQPSGSTKVPSPSKLGSIRSSAFSIKNLSSRLPTQSTSMSVSRSSSKTAPSRKSATGSHNRNPSRLPKPSDAKKAKSQPGTGPKSASSPTLRSKSKSKQNKRTESAKKRTPRSPGVRPKSMTNA